MLSSCLKVTQSTLLLAILGSCTLAAVMPARAFAQCPDTATMQSDIARAESAYVRRQYLEVLRHLRPLLAPQNCLPLEQEIEALLLVGVAQHELGDLHAAQATLLDMLRLDPDFVAGAVIDIPTSLITFIDDIQMQHAEELRQIRIAKGRIQGVVVETLYVVVEETENQFWINFVPFGAGQFQNEDWAWGITFLSLQLAAIGVSALGASMVEVVRGDTFTFTPAERRAAVAWQQVQIGGAIAFAALYLGGSLHGVYHYEPRRRNVLPPQSESPEGIAQATTTSWQLSPLGVDRGAGVAWTLSF